MKRRKRKIQEKDKIKERENSKREMKVKSVKEKGKWTIPENNRTKERE